MLRGDSFLLLTKEDAARLPLFVNHRAARQWFKSIYRERFVLVRTEIKDNVKRYYYHLVIDKDVYLSFLEDKEKITQEVLQSFQPIEITEHGSVFID